MKLNKNDFVPAKQHIRVSTGDVIRILREMKLWTQDDLSKRSGISVTNISLLENNRIDIGKKHAEQLARAFRIHPSMIMFPGHRAVDLKRAA